MKSTPMTVKELIAYLENVPNTISVLIRADHSKGKSEIVKQFGKKKQLPLIDLRFGQIDIGDIIYPKAVGNKYLHLLSEYIKPVFDAPGILFLDEPNRGQKDTMQAAFQLILDRQYHAFRLHPETYVIAAMNSDMEKYIWNEIDPAMYSLFALVDFEPTVEEWLEYGEKEGVLEPEVIYTIRKNPTLADPEKKEDGNYEHLLGPHTNRRSWTMFSLMLKKYKKEYPKYFSNQEQFITVRTFCSTFIGQNAAEFFKLAIENGKEMDEMYSHNLEEISKKVNDLIEGRFRFKEYDDTEIEKRIKELNVFELECFADELVKFFMNFQVCPDRTIKELKHLGTVMNSELYISIVSKLPTVISDKLK